MTLDPTAQMQVQMFESAVKDMTTDQIVDQVKRLHADFIAATGPVLVEVDVRAALPGGWEKLAAAMRELALRKALRRA